MKTRSLRQSRATVFGALAILFWSSTAGLSRSLTETLGTLTASSCVFLLGGTIASLHMILTARRHRRPLSFPVRYLVGCGILFVIYMVSLYLAIGFASNRQQVLEVALINYLWPALTLVFAVPILKKKARGWLVLGIFAGFTGIFLSMFPENFSWIVFADNVKANWLPYLLASIAGVTWALYSNLSRLWGGQAESGAVPFFLLLSGLMLMGLRVLFPENTQWTLRAVLELIYLMIFPTGLGYLLWDEAMRKGRIILVASLSYFTPLLSAIIGVAYLGVRAGWNLWAGAIFVVVGAAVCRLSVQDDS